MSTPLDRSDSAYPSEGVGESRAAFEHIGPSEPTTLAGSQPTASAGGSWLSRSETPRPIKSPSGTPPEPSDTGMECAHGWMGKRADAPAGTAGASPLPCLNSDNSMENRVRAVRKTAFALVRNVDAFIKVVGLEQIGFLTLTYGDHVTDWKEGQRRFNSLMTNYGRKRFGHYLCVMEPQASGRLHYHLLVDVGEDIRTGFNFEEVKRGNYSSASPGLRSLWRELRGVMPRHGFGRHELLPIRACPEAMAHYLGKYLAKGARCRDERFKGARWVRYSRGWRTAYSTFAWNSPGSWCYRKKLAAIAHVLCLEYDDMKKVFGPKWAYWMGDIIQAMQLDEYPTPAHAFADGVDRHEFDALAVSVEDIRNIEGIRILGRITASEAARLTVRSVPRNR